MSMLGFSIFMFILTILLGVEHLALGFVPEQTSSAILAGLSWLGAIVVWIRLFRRERLEA